MNIPRIGPFTEAAEFDGKIIRSVGADNVRILLEQPEGGTISAECSAELIDRVARHARTSSIRIMGHASWGTEHGSAVRQGIGNSFASRRLTSACYEPRI